ncbi:MAG: 2-amino-4-hydroxy-6-hydroxymethyldihydropteridine diphosphokinase [Candidatus Electryoneaceae bacterium]|nr:2-amino-4-hydroxy-6-hydroxymethyldihydropteridine diphosphokinase [Candidatus Electryoneaceae bacterium]
MNKPVYLSLGSNLGDRLERLSFGIGQLRRLTAVGDIRISSIIETEPWGGVVQPFFLNCVVELTTNLDPVELLDVIKDIERQAGRSSDEIRWSARTLDIDILLYGDLIVSTERLTIPHPFLTVRRFVLTALKELAPDLIIPDMDKTIRRVLDDCSDRGKVTIYSKG